MLVSETRLLGAEHQETLISAKNLARLVWRCSLKNEAEQFLRDTRALARRTPGTNHEHTFGSNIRCASGHAVGQSRCEVSGLYELRAFW